MRGGQRFWPNGRGAAWAIAPRRTKSASKLAIAPAPWTMRVVARNARVGPMIDAISTGRAAGDWQDRWPIQNCYVLAEPDKEKAAIVRAGPRILPQDAAGLRDGRLLCRRTA